MISDGDAVAHCLAGEHGLRAGKSQFETDEITLALMHRYEANTDQDKCQDEGKIIVVVHRAQQHRECHDAEDNTDTCRQDVNAARDQSRRGWVRTLAFAGPALDACGGSRFEGAPKSERLREWPQNRGHVDKVRQGFGIVCHRQA